VFDGVFLQHLDMVSRLVYHRGFTHSLVFCVVGGGLGAWLCGRFFSLNVSFRRWYVAWFLAFFTHAILDCFTSWGTQFFWPHSTRVAWHSIFIVDPFYTIPLLIGVLMTGWTRRVRPVRIAVVVSSLYLMWGLGVKQVVNGKFEQGLRAQGISTQRFISRPTPFNSFLWSVTADDGEHYYTGYYSIFDVEPPKHFLKSRAKQHGVLASFSDHVKLQQLLFFTQGFYIVASLPEAEQARWVIYDARYGLFGAWDASFQGEYIFQYQVDPARDYFVQHRPAFQDMSALFRSMLGRI
jgi:inner membrane protein